jgi:hypothetical protein
MIVDLFPKAGGTPVTIKSRPYVHNFEVNVPEDGDVNKLDNLYFDDPIGRQRMAIGNNASLYLIGHNYGYKPPLNHFARVTWSPLTGYSKHWSIYSETPTFERVVTDSAGLAYVTRSDGTLEKYNEEGEVLWTIPESGVLCVGGNGNIFVWTAAYIKEYDTDGHILNTWEYTCTGTPVTLYANANKDFFLVTSEQLTRLTSSLEVLWTYAASFNVSTLYDANQCAVDIDELGNFYMYGDISGLSVKCIGSDGVEKWHTSQLSYSNHHPYIWVDNLGGVYVTCSNTPSIGKLDAKTGLIIEIRDEYEYSMTKAGCADKYGNVYVWHEWMLYGFHPYLGTVNWVEDGNTHEQFVIHEVERGDGYMILHNDIHNEKEDSAWAC